MAAPKVRIVPITTQEQRREFAKFPWRIYRNDPYWAPPIFGDRLTLLDPDKHPFWEHADQQLFLAMRGEEIVGTISAHVSHRHNEVHGDKVGFFGFFEVVEDYAVAEALFDAAATWLREQGMEAIRGPESPSQNEECGLLVDGFDMPPVVMMTIPRTSGGCSWMAGICHLMCSSDVEPLIARFRIRRFGKTADRQMPCISGNSSGGFSASQSNSV